MKTNRKLIGVLCLGIVLCFGLIALFQLKQVEARRAQEHEVARQVVNAVGSSILAEAYKMPQKDYNKLMRLKNQLLKKRVISDNDLEWLLARLKPTSDLIVHLRILGMLELLGNAPPSQKEQIKSALLPYVEKDDPRFRNSLKRIHKFVFGKPDWKPGDPPF